MGDFCFNGHWASEFGLVVERHPRQYVPEKNLTIYEIPGRVDPLTQWDGSYKPYVQPYECWFKSAPVATQAHRIKEWLLSAPAGARLEDTYDEDVFRTATYRGGAAIENCRDRFGRMTLEFTCAAPSWYKQGQEPVRIEPRVPIVVRNDGHRAAYPLLKLHGNGHAGCVVVVDGHEIDILWGGSGPDVLFFDCALHEAWEIVDGVEHPVNEKINLSIHSFPALAPGDNLVELRGIGVEYLELIPRTWTL